jgi:hypothetical protein
MRENLISMPSPTTKGHIYLYDNFNPGQSYRNFIYNPIIDYAARQGSGYLKTIIKLPLKYVDISLQPLTEADGLTPEEVTKYNSLRRIELYGMYPRDQTASSLAEGVHHSAEMEPEWAYRANPSKYMLIKKIVPGESFSAQEPNGYKKILIIATI